MGDKKKYTGNIYLWAERKQGERPDKRQMEKERRQRNVAVGIVIIVEPGNPNTQRLYVSDKADEALEEKKKIYMWLAWRENRNTQTEGPTKNQVHLKKLQARTSQEN